MGSDMKETAGDDEAKEHTTSNPDASNALGFSFFL